MSVGPTQSQANVLFEIENSDIINVTNNNTFTLVTLWKSLASIALPDMLVVRNLP